MQGSSYTQPDHGPFITISDLCWRGQWLSGGQVQRLAIARTILKNPQIVLLDKATSAINLYTSSSKFLPELIKTLNVPIENTFDPDCFDTIRDLKNRSPSSPCSSLSSGESFASPFRVRSSSPRLPHESTSQRGPGHTPLLPSGSSPCIPLSDDLHADGHVHIDTTLSRDASDLCSELEPGKDSRTHCDLPSLASLNNFTKSSTLDHQQTSIEPKILELNEAQHIEHLHRNAPAPSLKEIIKQQFLPPRRNQQMSSRGEIRRLISTIYFK
ncbi:hypothetical protein F5B18DRAFT_126436 [Nemania serpens]|nr:hypothetical protein F5B18DRAFT_126436 [Nemania serpens]